MAPYRFRLARVLDWYKKQSHIEGERLRLCVEGARQARTAIENHQRNVNNRHTELIRSERPQAHELAALGPFLRSAKRQELNLRQTCSQKEQEVERQRRAALEAQRRVRLVENLRERQSSEHQYEADRELEALASETHLAGFVRNLNSKSSIS